MLSKAKSKRKEKPRRARRAFYLVLNAGLVLLLVVLVLALGGALARIFGLWGSEADHVGQEVASSTGADLGGPLAIPANAESQRFGPVEVTPAQVDLGRVPLSTWVTPTFKVRNVSQVPVTLLVPTYSVQTLEGC